MYMKVFLLLQHYPVYSVCLSAGGRVTHSLRVPGLHIYDKKFITLGDIYFLESQHGTELSESQPSSLSQPVTVPLQRGSVSATSPPSVVPLQHLAQTLMWIPWLHFHFPFSPLSALTLVFIGCLLPSSHFISPNRHKTACHSELFGFQSQKNCRFWDFCKSRRPLDV